MNILEKERRILEVMDKTIHHALTLEAGSIEYRVTMEEILDCAKVIEERFDKYTVKRMLGSTTSPGLYHILSDIEGGIR